MEQIIVFVIPGALGAIIGLLWIISSRLNAIHNLLKDRIKGD